MGLSLITKGILTKIGDIISPTYNVTRIYYPLTIDINKQKPTISIRNINTKINLTIKPYEE